MLYHCPLGFESPPAVTARQAFKRLDIFDGVIACREICDGVETAVINVLFKRKAPTALKTVELHWPGRDVRFQDMRKEVYLVTTKTHVAWRTAKIAALKGVNMKL
jgi:hypothetical protein